MQLPETFEKASVTLTESFFNLGMAAVFPWVEAKQSFHCSHLWFIIAAHFCVQMCLVDRLPSSLPPISAALLADPELLILLYVLVYSFNIWK